MRAPTTVPGGPNRARRYTQDLTFAREYAYPLLEGLNAWWGCFLRKVPRVGAPGGYVYTDDSAADPDNEHEGQKVPNPQIGLALIRRSLEAQLAIGKAIGATPVPLVADMLAHLAPFNVGESQAKVILSFYTVKSAIGCHSLGIYTVILLSLPPFSAKMALSPRASSPKFQPKTPAPVPTL
jgi:hypothetical protein